MCGGGGEKRVGWRGIEVLLYMYNVYSLFRFCSYCIHRQKTEPEVKGNCFLWDMFSLRFASNEIQYNDHQPTFYHQT